ncbi:flagellin [Rhizobium sp. 2MFCol3.1]|uniref:flagellin n=1 Tax=Rhizobium sp. 2MFCol3.1 TaxID=1246459 RepID=UPI002475AE86|nr:flagellin [Rhizobium sp. 2MFCol3.1]
MDIDIASNPDMVGVYTSYIEIVTRDITSAASVLGSLQKGIEMQTDFASRFMDSIDSGVGRLVDADMEEESSRLSALQTQQQLSIQVLSIANATPSFIQSLFR